MFIGFTIAHLSNDIIHVTNQMVRIVAKPYFMSTVLSEEERAALQVLRATHVGVLEAALVAKEALGASRGRVSRAKKCIRLGADALRMREKTVRFETAVAEALDARKDRRARTLSDFRYICRRLMKRCPGLAQRRLRSLSPQECAEYLHAAFNTPRQFVKVQSRPQRRFQHREAARLVRQEPGAAD